MKFEIGLTTIAIGSLLFTAFQSLIYLLLSERLKTSLQKEHSTFLENLRWDTKIREQAVGVAEYLSIAPFLKEDSPPDDFRKANLLAWQLAMWLPANIYKEMVRSVANPQPDVNAHTTVIAVRKLLLGDKAGDLDADKDLLIHAPGIGKVRL